MTTRRTTREKLFWQKINAHIVRSTDIGKTSLHIFDIGKVTTDVDGRATKAAKAEKATKENDTESGVER